MLLAVTVVGLLIGIRLPSTFIAILLIVGLAVFALVKSPHDHSYVTAAASTALALTIGYCCGTARPRYAPSGVLAISALYLPSIITALPQDTAEWPSNGGADHQTLAGRTALAIACGSAFGLAMLHRFRPRGRRKPGQSVDDDSLADI